MPVYSYKTKVGNIFDVRQNIKDQKFITLAQVLEKMGERFSIADTKIQVKRVLSAPLNRWRFLD